MRIKRGGENEPSFGTREGKENGIVNFETLEELVEQRRGYKYLSKDGVSPYQSYQYNLKSKRVLTTNLNTDLKYDCGEGWNLATLKWIADNCLNVDGVIVEVSIPDDAKIIIPLKSNGKFRTDKIKFKKIHKIDSLFPTLKKLNKSIKSYKPINPIKAEVMPNEDKIKTIMASVGASVRDSVGASVWASVGASVWASVGDSVRDSVWASVWASVRDYCYICGYYAIKLFFNLVYEHPVFDLIRLGVIVIKVSDKYKVYGKNGKHLGDIDIEEEKS